MRGLFFLTSPLLLATMDEQCPITVACTSVARTIFSIEKLRFGQLEAVVAAVQAKDSVIILPTGAGKSRCFQLVPFVQKELKHTGGLVIVIQPIVALLQNQVKDLMDLGLKAALDAQVQDRDPTVLNRASKGDLDFRKAPPLVFFIIFHRLNNTENAIFVWFFFFFQTTILVYVS